MRRAVSLACLALLAAALTPRLASAGWPCCQPVYCAPYCWPTCYAPAYCTPCYYAPYYPLACYWPCTPVYCEPYCPPVVYHHLTPPIVHHEPSARGASVSVVAPKEVAVYVEGVRVPLQGGRLTFDVPDLKDGQRYSYQFRAEGMRDGQVQQEQRVVTFRAGERVRVDFIRPAAPVARN